VTARSGEEAVLEWLLAKHAQRWFVSSPKRDPSTDYLLTPASSEASSQVCQALVHGLAALHECISLSELLVTNRAVLVWTGLGLTSCGIWRAALNADRL